MLMDTYAASGCKLLRSCFSLVMQLNQNQFYCFDPIENLLISCFYVLSSHCTGNVRFQPPGGVLKRHAVIFT